jgi:hypothetical protein
MMRGAKASLAASITALEGLDRAGCLNHWREAFGRPPPKHLSPQFKRRILIWDLQNRVLGGLPARTAKSLVGIAIGKTKASTNSRTVAKPGSHLVREWNGRTYQVEVTSGGYVMDGRTWRSLSAIAKHITGAHWSGPRFFGVR